MMEKKLEQKLRKVLDRIEDLSGQIKDEDLSGQIKDLENEVEQVVLDAYDSGSEDGYIVLKLLARHHLS